MSVLDCENKYCPSKVAHLTNKKCDLIEGVVLCGACCQTIARIFFQGKKCAGRKGRKHVKWNDSPKETSQRVSGSNEVFRVASALSDDDPFSALLYSEYALELSNLDIYFKDGRQKIGYKFKLDREIFIVFFVGAIVGIFLIKTIEKKVKKIKKGRRKK